MDDANILHMLLRPVIENQSYIVVALMLVVLDVVVGFTNAVAHSEVSSSKMRSGLWHKLGSAFLMVAAGLIDGALLGGIDLGFKSPVMTVVCLYIAVMELVSILENIVKLNPELADNPLVGRLTARKEGADGERR